MSVRPKQWILGGRGSGISRELGVFIAPDGVDAETASPDELLVHITSQTAQIWQRGIVAGPFPQDVMHTLGFAPLALPNLVGSDRWDRGQEGYLRPFASGASPWLLTNLISKADRLTFNQSQVNGIYSSGLPAYCNYFMFNRPLP